MAKLTAMEWLERIPKKYAKLVVPRDPEERFYTLYTMLLSCDWPASIHNQMVAIKELVRYIPNHLEVTKVTVKRVTTVPYPTMKEWLSRIHMPIRDVLWNDDPLSLGCGSLSDAIYTCRVWPDEHMEECVALVGRVCAAEADGSEVTKVTPTEIYTNKDIHQ